MATLTIRNLPDEVRDRLRVRAAENGRSMEAEARTVLERAFALQTAEITPEGQRQRARKAQRAMRPYQVPGLLASEELIADRRLEAWKETVEAMHDIRARGGPIDAEELLRNASNVRRRP
jgi:plasmid stability protein